MTATERIAKSLANHEKEAGCPLLVGFVESCTAGLVSATLAQMPGISRWLCGSLVVYQPGTKQEILGITPGQIERHTTESPEMAALITEYATGLLRRARWMVGVVGHLGPHAPPEKDGVIHVWIMDMNIMFQFSGTVEITHKLTSTDRISRMEEAANFVLTKLAEVMESRENVKREGYL